MSRRSRARTGSARSLNSIGIGAASTLIATCLGTLAALGLSRTQFPLRSLIMPIIISPMIVPIVVVAAGFYLIFAPLGLVNSYPGVVLAHAALGTPFVVITVTASLLSFDQSLLRAASGLGATPWVTFRRVTLPLITPAVATGSVFAFATSFDEVIVILFIGGPDQTDRAAADVERHSRLDRSFDPRGGDDADRVRRAAVREHQLAARPRGGG